MAATMGTESPQQMLSPEVSRFTRIRSNLLRTVASQALPKQVIFWHGDRGGPKRVALTFDDGPDEMTHEYVALLDELATVATFFVIGDRAEQRPDVVHALIAAGHEVASHGFTHKSFTEMSAPELTDELMHASEVLPPMPTGRPIVRPPRGAISPTSVLRTATSGFSSVLWSLDSDDCRTVDPARIAAAVSPDKVRPGEIVLMHEGQQWTLDALLAIIPRLRSAGYDLVTVGDLMNEA